MKRKKEMKLSTQEIMKKLWNITQGKQIFLLPKLAIFLKKMTLNWIADTIYVSK